MTISSPETLKDFAVDSSTPILPACDSSKESQEDMANDMTGVYTNNTKKSNNICYEGISQSSPSKKAHTDITSELSLSVVAASYSSTTKNTTVLDEADFHHFDDITKHTNVIKEILRECSRKNASNQSD